MDTFSYRIVDSTGRPSEVVTVSLKLNQSQYQNPLADLSEDVNADGLISAIDALRVINFLSRELSDGSATSVPVSEIGAPPPDYYDTNGNGQISASDALRVINKLRTQDNVLGESVAWPAASAVTTGYAAGSTASLPVRYIEPVSAAAADDDDDDDDDEEASSLDVVLTTGFEISSPATEHAVDAVSMDEATTASPPDSVDEALSHVLDEMSLSGDLD